MKQQSRIFSVIAGTLLSFSMFAHADGGETAKQISNLSANNDGSYFVNVASPNDSLNQCFFGIMQIPASTNQLVKSAWFSTLLAARLAQTPVTVSFTSTAGGTCTIVNVTIPS